MSIAEISPAAPVVNTAVIVYGKPGCMPCRSTKKFLESKGVEVDYRDITTDTEALTTIQNLGYSGVPVIVAGGEHWQGYAPDRLAALVA